MQLSKNFTEAEFLKSQTAFKKGISNTWENEKHKQNAIYLCTNFLEPFREFIKKPIIILSGYRNNQLNSLVGGSKTSAHMTGEAVDLKIEGLTAQELYYKLMLFLKDRENEKPHDQLILESINGRFGDADDWVHLGIRTNGVNRKQYKTMIA